MTASLTRHPIPVTEAEALAAEARRAHEEMIAARTAAVKAATARAERIRTLNRAGWSYAKIGAELGISAHSAFKAATIERRDTD